VTGASTVAAHKASLSTPGQRSWRREQLHTQLRHPRVSVARSFIRRRGRHEDARLVLNRAVDLRLLVQRAWLQHPPRARSRHPTAGACVRGRARLCCRHAAPRTPFHVQTQPSCWVKNTGIEHPHFPIPIHVYFPIPLSKHGFKSIQLFISLSQLSFPMNQTPP